MTGYVLSSNALFPILSSTAAYLIVNPNNDRATIQVREGLSVESYFEESIASRVNTYLNLYGITIITVGLISGILLLRNNETKIESLLKEAG
jgi:citrate lyase gamma subunit